MTLSDFEDPRQLFKCSVADCEHDRAGNTPLCARHLRQQEVDAGRTSISEPALENRLRNVRTEDDEHPGEKKVYDPETGEASWVPDPDRTPPGVDAAPQVYVGPDPDTALPDLLKRPEITRIPESHQTSTTTPGGCWVTYHPDWSGFALFEDEMEALRHAVANHMSVGRAHWGQELGGGRYPG